MSTTASCEMITTEGSKCGKRFPTLPIPGMNRTLCGEHYAIRAQAIGFWPCLKCRGGNDIPGRGCQCQPYIDPVKA